MPKKPPITIQQFLDAYMKKTKPISKRNSPSNAEQHSTPPRAVEKAVAEEIPEIQNKCGSNNVLDSNNEVSDIDTDSLEENAKIVETMSKDDDKNKALILTCNEKETEDDHEINEQEASKIVFDIMDEQYDVIPEMITSENISKSFTNTTNCSNIQTEINTDNNGKKQNDSTKYLFELIFKVSKLNVNNERRYVFRSHLYLLPHSALDIICIKVHVIVLKKSTIHNTVYKKCIVAPSVEY